MITTDIDYPKGLPYPLIEDRQVNHVSPFVRTSMASGRARQRRAFTSVPSMQGVSFIMNDAQAQAFEVWFSEVLEDATEWFNIKLKTPMGFTQEVCRFAEMYSGPNPLGPNLWRISASIEVYERPLLPREWAEFPDLILGSSIIDIALNDRWPEA